MPTAIVSNPDIEPAHLTDHETAADQAQSLQGPDGAHDDQKHGEQSIKLVSWPLLFQWLFDYAARVSHAVRQHQNKKRNMYDPADVVPLLAASNVCRCSNQKIAAFMSATRFPTVRNSIKKELQMTTYTPEFEMVNVMLNRHTWVLVADGEKALFLRNKHDMK